MITLCLGPGVAMSDATDWTPTKKAVALGWMAFIDVLIIALCCA